MLVTGGAESVERAESIERTFEMPDKLGSNKKNMKYWKYAIKIIVYVYEFCNFSIIFFSLYVFKPVQPNHVFSKKN